MSSVREIDVGVITGSGVYELSGGSSGGSSDGSERRVVAGRFGEAEVVVFRVGGWRIGAISRHLKGHFHLPNTISHRANLAALKSLGARAVLATTSVGAASSRVSLGRPVVFDDLYFPDNRLPDGRLCTIFDEPGQRGRGHWIFSEPFSPRLRRRLEDAAEEVAGGVTRGGVYAHTNGPRFETAAEIQALASFGVSAVSQTCGPEAVLAGELEMSYALVGFPVNYATGVGEAETKEDLERLLARSSEALPRIVLKAVASLEDADLQNEPGYVYRIEGELGRKTGEPQADDLTSDP